LKDLLELNNIKLGKYFSKDNPFLYALLFN